MYTEVGEKTRGGLNKGKSGGTNREKCKEDKEELSYIERMSLSERFSMAVPLSFDPKVILYFYIESLEKLEDLIHGYTLLSTRL